MGFLLSLWQPKNKTGELLKNGMCSVCKLIFIAFLVLPFIRFSGTAKETIKWVWLVCAICNIDIIGEYRKFHKEKTIVPVFTLFVILVLTYLYHYWDMLSKAIICLSIVIGILEFIISVYVYKTIRFSNKIQIKLSNKALQGIIMGGLYICAVTLLILGHFITKVIVFVFGMIAIVMLFISIMICIGNGLGFYKNVVKLISFTIDVISILFLIAYLIYLIPNDNNLQTIVLSIVASVMGGGLTLAGVAWTIKHNHKENKENERNRVKPYIYPVGWEEISNRRSIKNIVFKNNGDNRIDTCIGLFKNTDNGILIAKKLVINETEYTVYMGDVIAKMETASINVCIDFDMEVKEWLLYCNDVLGNEIIYKMESEERQIIRRITEVNS